MRCRSHLDAQACLSSIAIVLCCFLNPSTISEEDREFLQISTEWSAPGGAMERQFGHAVACDGDLVVVASDHDGDKPTTQGVVRLFELDSTLPTEDRILRAPDREWPDRFGAALALDTGHLLVGAPHDAEHGWDAGAAWLFKSTSDGWQLEQRLQTATEAGSQFGSAVALHGNVAVVGSPRSDGIGLDTGAAYIFEKIAGRWQLNTMLVAPDAADADFFARSVAIEDDWIAIGAWGDDDHGEKTGSVWLFRFDGERWFPFQKLVPVEAQARDRFGWQVALASGQLLVSACGSNDDRGVVYVHEFDGRAWRQTQILSDPSGARGDWFGFALATNEKLAVVGSPGADARTDLEGRATVYRRLHREWIRIGAISSGPSSGAQPVQFGWSVATDGSRVVVGRIDDADGPAEAGRAWLLEIATSITSTGVPEPVSSAKR